MSNEDETIQRMSATIQENARELLKQDAEIKSLQSERDEYRQRLQENVKSIESMLHHNEVLTKERDRIREAGNNLANISKEYNEALSKIFEKDSPAIVRINMFINQWNTLTKKEVSDGE